MIKGIKRWLLRQKWMPFHTFISRNVEGAAWGILIGGLFGLYTLFILLNRDNKQLMDSLIHIPVLRYVSMLAGGFMIASALVFQDNNDMYMFGLWLVLVPLIIGMIIGMIIDAVWKPKH